MNVTNNDSTFNSSINTNTTSTTTSTETLTTSHSMIVDIEINNNNNNDKNKDENGDVYEGIDEYLSLMYKNMTSYPTIPSVDEQLEVLLKNTFANLPDIVQEKLERRLNNFINQAANLRLKPSKKESIRIWKLYVTKQMNKFAKSVELMYNRYHLRNKNECLANQKHLNDDCFIHRFWKPFYWKHENMGWENVAFFNDPIANKFVRLYSKFYIPLTSPPPPDKTYSHDLSHILILYTQHCIQKQQNIQHKYTTPDDAKPYFTFLHFLTEVYQEFHQPGCMCIYDSHSLIKPCTYSSCTY